MFNSASTLTKKSLGFTLIEVLISVAIFVALLSEAVPMLNGYSSGASLRADDEQLKNSFFKARNFAKANNIQTGIISESKCIVVSSD